VKRLLKTRCFYWQEKNLALGFSIKAGGSCSSFLS
jgi:hypothetical protein